MKSQKSAKYYTTHNLLENYFRFLRGKELTCLVGVFLILFQLTFTCSKSTITINRREICSKLTITAPERLHQQKN